MQTKFDCRIFPCGVSNCKVWCGVTIGLTLRGQLQVLLSNGYSQLFVRVLEHCIALRSLAYGKERDHILRRATRSSLRVDILFCWSKARLVRLLWRFAFACYAMSHTSCFMPEIRTSRDQAVRSYLLFRLLLDLTSYGCFIVDDVYSQDRSRAGE